MHYVDRCHELIVHSAINWDLEKKMTRSVHEFSTLVRYRYLKTLLHTKEVKGGNVVHMYNYYCAF